MRKPQKNHDRAPGETQITISLPQSLKDELTELAAQDERSRSKWIVRELKALVLLKKKDIDNATKTVTLEANDRKRTKKS